MVSLLNYKDLFFTPTYFLLVFFLSIIINQRINKNKPHLKKIFMWGVYIRFIGAIAFGLVYTFFYGGDTYSYFTNGSRYIWEAFLENPKTGLSIIFSDPSVYNLDNLYYTNQMPLWNGSSSIIKLSGFIGLFTFHTYILNALFFSLFCFSGLWVIYITLLEYYPHLYKKLSFTILFFPSLVFWGSGIMKDPLSLGALGWAFYAAHSAFIKRRNIIKSLLILIASFWVIAIYKSYILLSFIPAFSLYIFLATSNKIRNSTTKALFKPVLIFLAIVFSYFGIAQLTKGTEYDIKTIAYKSAITYAWIKYSSNSTSSVYDLGEMDGSILGMLKAFPQAVNVSLFRPYIWEVKNEFMFLSSLESMYLLFLTLALIFKSGPANIFKQIKNDALISFLVIFSLAFAFGTGVSTGNFGTLVRYKIPLIPFYLSAIFIIIDKVAQSKVKQTNGPISTQALLK